MRPLQAVKHIFKSALAVVAALFFMSGCAAFTAAPDDARPADKLFEDGVAWYLDGGYQDAEKDLKRLIEGYPLSPYAKEAQVWLADVYYVTERYDEAFAQYTAFAAMHPSHPRAEYALFQKGMCHLRDMLPIDRDPTVARKALFAFEEFASVYPGSAYAPKARELARFITGRLAQRELSIARFYFKKKSYKGALGRYKEVLKNFPNTDVIDETLFYIGESYTNLGEMSLASETYSTLLKDFPDSPFAARAKERLGKGNGV